MEIGRKNSQEKNLIHPEAKMRQKLQQKKAMEKAIEERPLKEGDNSIAATISDSEATAMANIPQGEVKNTNTHPGTSTRNTMKENRGTSSEGK
ncbi:hypothetical protein [Chitiniphilus eburneus]|uniref:Uncharacterized protein n=1 Tax=Chitiniphilus eburneus TaxID=2571148 RepID=A0A4U0QJF2_9NEIS|nr:hypothetical protein [Chitiniphilus eburneus]TJZ76194.1 hypothetical protein FAZ21_05305 [Chitiniphilus eburneus]